jgi:uncharacterized protein (DUF1697 family)
MGSRYVALLRGVNVGGRNPVAMAALRTCFERAGFGRVQTYIQSGNVLFSTDAGGRVELARRIDTLLTATLGYQVTVVLRDRRQMEQVVAGAPAGFGSRPALYRYDVFFLGEPLSAASAVTRVPVREGVDAVFPGKGVLYASRLVSRASQSRIGRIVGLSMYQQITIRNWNTTTVLTRMLASTDDTRHRAGGG